jgi:protein-S-isoprenylcysteine O-methyltransferase Ste14
MTPRSGDNPGVIAPPPLIYLGGIVVGTLLERLWRWRLPTEAWGTVVGALLLIAAVGLFQFAVASFKHAQTSPKPHKPTTAIVTSGPFRYTRNPIYVAFTLAQVGIALSSRSGWILALVVPVLALVRYGVVAREERYLERKFGDEYVSYRARVRRWL